MSGKIAHVFFDDSGNTGNDLANPSQTNMFIGGILVLPEAADKFWACIASVSASATNLCGVADAELKGSELYMGRGRYAGVPAEERYALIQQIAQSIENTEGIYVVWNGFPKHMLAARLQTSPKRMDVWKEVLISFSSLLHGFLSNRHPGYHFLVTGDENNLVKRSDCLTSPTWDSFVNYRVYFASSDSSLGLQVADVIVHTLYRANRNNLRPDRATAPPSGDADQLADTIRISLTHKILIVAPSQST